MRSHPNLVPTGRRSAARNLSDHGKTLRRGGGLARPGKCCAVYPDPVHDNRQLARHGDDRTAQAAPLGDGHAPGLECRPALDTREQGQRGLDEGLADSPVNASRTASRPPAHDSGPMWIAAPSS